MVVQSLHHDNPGAQDYWYRYDAMNRFVGARGTFDNGGIVRGLAGIDYTYDAAGRKATQTTSVLVDDYPWQAGWTIPGYEGWGLVATWVDAHDLTTMVGTPYNTGGGSLWWVEGTVTRVAMVKDYVQSRVTYEHQYCDEARVTSMTVTPDTASPGTYATTTFTYDARGYLISAESNEAKLAYLNDDDGRLTAQWMTLILVIPTAS